jgi:hypothetical protein
VIKHVLACLLARGRTGPDGRFELVTNGQKGVPAGHYRVAVVHMVVTDGAASHSTTHHAHLVLHPKYASFDTSGLTREVQAGENDFTFELEAAGAAPRRQTFERR